jgi:hypothetical protein
MLKNRLLDASERALVKYVEALFVYPERFEGVWAETPFVGGIFNRKWPYDTIVLKVCRALAARDRFRRERPAWAPDLPLRRDDCEELENSSDPRLRLVGFYGSSMHLAEWEDHPGFDRFVRGLMFDRYTPREIRKDPALRKEFPPCRLEGMTDGWLTWRSPKTLAEHRRIGLRWSRTAAEVSPS